MNKSELLQTWKEEEKIAHIHGWDFSHIEGRCIEEKLSWDYKEIIQKYLTSDMKLLDIDTGGGEFLLSLNHPYENTYATENYETNVELCKKELLPLGINFVHSDAEKSLPFPNNFFDIVINRHGSFNVKEIKRILKPNGIFITQQVGAENDRELVELLYDKESLPPLPFPHQTLQNVQSDFEKCGFKTLQAKEEFPLISFLNVASLVWFARIIQWEFPNFSVENNQEKLFEVQTIIEENGKLVGRTHRFLLVAKSIAETTLALDSTKSKVIAICGKICSGKSYYANELKQNYNAVILSCDELTKELFDNNLGENHDEMMCRIKEFYKKQSIELINAGCNVILDWGFWSKNERKEITSFYTNKNIPLEWHYVNVSDDQWKKNIAKRNQLVKSGNGESSYFLDEGLLQKLGQQWQEPAKEEIDVWYSVPNRNK